MSDFWVGVLQNVVAQWLGVSATVCLSGLIATIVVLSRRRRLFTFLGLAERADVNPEIVVYLSNVRVKPGGALYVSQSHTNPFEISTVVAAEFLELGSLERMFSDGFVGMVPSGIRSRLAQRISVMAKIRSTCEAAPADVSKARGRVLVTVGGVEFNSITAHYMSRQGVFMRFAGQQCSTGSRSHVEVVDAHGRHQTIMPHSDVMDIAIVQKQVLAGEDRCVFYASGNGSNGTRAAIRYLVERWPDLYRRYGKEPFAVCLQCERRSFNPEGYTVRNVLRRIPERDS
jgi:hypothetical protein